MAFMIETLHVIRPTRFASESEQLQQNYADCWSGVQKHFDAKVR
jgi:homogentisate 1,2-dioxygenase